MNGLVGACGKIFAGVLNNVNVIPVRTRYLNWTMRRDVKKRVLATEYSQLRTRFVALKKARGVLSERFQEDGLARINALPKDSHPTRATHRCVLTARAQGVVEEHRLSRIMFRHLADYNKLSGVIRAKW